MDINRRHKHGSSYTIVEEFVRSYPIFQYEFVKTFNPTVEQEFILQILPCVAGPDGVEPPTAGFEDQNSIQLS